ncbi:hypothetical protein E2542_SST22294 [Spatholobus suberectus]|nr:hypothetical protein E2542_SST22294 [Spatholobus suberectus]
MQSSPYWVSTTNLMTPLFTRHCGEKQGSASMWSQTKEHPRRAFIGTATSFDEASMGHSGS